METIAQTQDYKVVFNGSKTYMFLSGDDCIFASSSKVQTLNRYKKYLQCAGL